MSDAKIFVAFKKMEYKIIPKTYDFDGKHVAILALLNFWGLCRVSTVFNNVIQPISFPGANFLLVI